MNNQRERDERWMRAAIEQSLIGQGWTSPRPSVGCVLVKEERVIGAGHTVPGDGNPHAEVVALQQAAALGQSTQSATAYVTLEPCSHFATTPPCTLALIEAGITRVVVGVGDPNPAIDGRGFSQLRAAGIEVVQGFMKAECARLHEQFLKHISQNQPFVTLKLATSLDGKIALPSGQSKWITGSESRERAHQLRHLHDAVLVGIGTVLQDDPQLDVRLDGEWKQPQRVVLDSTGRIPESARVLASGSTPSIVATTSAMPDTKKSQLEKRGAKVLICKQDAGRIAFTDLLNQLYENGIYSVLIEGGAAVAGSALRGNVVDKIAWLQAPILLGDGICALSGYETASLESVLRLRDVKRETLGNDELLTGYLR